MLPSSNYTYIPLRPVHDESGKVALIFSPNDNHNDMVLATSESQKRDFVEVIDGKLWTARNSMGVAQCNDCLLFTFSLYFHYAAQLFFDCFVFSI